MVTYTAQTPVTELDPVALGMHLAETLAGAMPWLEGVSGARAAIPQREGKWCAKEVIGHLIDSAVNNLQRIVRLEIVLDIEPEVRAQPYEQDEWVRAQHYAEREWVQLLELWRMLNGHLAWTMRHVAREHLGRLCVFPDAVVTMGFVMEDYVAHLEFHLAALKVWLE